MNKEEFYKMWDIEVYQIIKSGDEIVSTVDFAVSNETKHIIFNLLNKHFPGIDKLHKETDEFEFETNNGLLVVLKKIRRGGK